METVEFCTKEEFETLLKVAKNLKHKAQLLLMHDAGLRVSEMCVLKWSNFDFRARVITVFSLKSRKEGKNRKVPITERLYLVLAELIEKEKPATKDAFLFPSPSNTSKPIGRTAVNNTFYKLRAKAPEIGRVYPHKLRHTFATNLRANNAELADVRDLLGHQSLNTTLIYAHADASKLRAMVNASAPKMGRFAQIKQKLLGKPARRVNWSLFESGALIGREAEAKRIAELTSKGVSVLVTGAIGVGKNALLDAVKFEQPVLEIDDCKEWKKSLANVLLHLFGGDKESVFGLFYGKEAENDKAKHISKESLPALSKMLTQLCRPGEYVLKINDLDNITPTVVKSLEILKSHFVIVATARAMKMQNAGFVWNFERVELQNLDRPQTLRLVHHLTQDLLPEDAEHMRNKVWDISQGNPKMIQELCARFAKEPVLDVHAVSEICGNYIGKQTQEIDMSIYLLLIFGALAVLRYLAAEQQNPSLRFIGGVFMIALMFGRYFFNSQKRRAL